MKERQVIPNGEMIDGYKVVGLVGFGGFGNVYKVRSNHTYAMKTENINSKRHLLQIEIQILKELKGDSFPKYISSGKSKEYNINYLIMTFFGQSINEIQIHHDYKLSINVAYNLSLKMLESIKKFHKFGFVHRDIKPGNFLLKNNTKCPIVLIDFNLSARHTDPSTKKPYPQIKEEVFIGTVLFASIDVLSSLSCGPNDDLIAWFYSFLFLTCGTLPWAEEKDKSKSIELKKAFKVADLNHKFSPKFQELYDYLKKLNYYDTPDYKHIKRLFISGMKDDNVYSDVFDWHDFIQKNSCMTKNDEKMNMLDLKVVDDRNKENKENDAKKRSKKGKKHISENKNKNHSKKGKKDGCLVE